MTSFIKKWNGKHLADDGCYVSREFNAFQNAFKREIEKIAQNIGATLVRYSKGHYDMCGFIERGGKYVFFDYSSALCGERSRPALTDSNAMYCRRAKNDKDYRGEYNRFTSFADCKETIDMLLK